MESQHALYDKVLEELESFNGKEYGGVRPDIFNSVLSCLEKDIHVQLSIIRDLPFNAAIREDKLLDALSECTVSSIDANMVLRGYNGLVSKGRGTTIRHIGHTLADIVRAGSSLLEEYSHAGKFKRYTVRTSLASELEKYKEASYKKKT